MSKNIQKKAIDITGVEFTPAKPSVCLGNGVQGFECCCDECDYFYCVFPQRFVILYKKSAGNLSECTIEK